MSTISLSPSRAGDFRICPQLYKFRAIDRLPEPPSEPAMRGTVVHVALQKLFDHPPRDRTIDTALNEFDAAWVDIVDAEAREALFSDADAEFYAQQTAEKYIRNYFDLEAPEQLEPVGREIRLETTLERVRVVGILDRVDRTRDGTFVISDYKTGRTPELSRSLGNFFGLDVYAALFTEVFGAIPARVRLIYLDAPDTFMLEPTRRDIENTKRTLDALAGAIMGASARADWRPRVSGFCKFCSFKDRCPAHVDVTELAAAGTADEARLELETTSS